MFQRRRDTWVVKLASILVLLCGLALLAACGPTEIEFAVKHLRDQPGEQVTEEVSHVEYPGLDNSSGTAPLQVQINLEREYRYQIVERLTSDEVSSQRVREKIVELYKLPPNDPEGTVQRALCPLSIVIPAGRKAVVTIEWTERWAEGVINEGTEGSGDQLGTYRVFLGYIEPCSLVRQENVN
jgi:hypothetical protein